MNETSEKFRGLFKTIQEQQPGLLKTRKKKLDKRRQRKRVKTFDAYGQRHLTPTSDHQVLNQFYRIERTTREPIPVRKMTETFSGTAHPSVPHYWLCDGRLLVLTQPENEENVHLFKV